MKRRLSVVAGLVVLLLACGGPPSPKANPLVVTIYTYMALDDTMTLALYEVLANRDATLAVEAICYLNTPSGDNLARYVGTISVGTQSSTRFLSMSGTDPSPDAITITCDHITGFTPEGEHVTISVRP